MGLISEDDVLALLANHHFDQDKGNFDLLIHNLCKEVKCIPTAYDVDKVMEQLKNYSYTETQDDMNPFEPVKVVTLEYAIEIVKAGGIDAVD